MDIRCFIKETEYPLVGGFEIFEQAASPTVSKITVDITGLPEPRPLDRIYIFVDNGLYFFGHALIPESPTIKSAYNLQKYTKQIPRPNNYFQRRYLNRAFIDMWMHEIVGSIRDTLLEEENIALGEITQWIPTEYGKDLYIAKDMRVYDALNELAENSGSTWNIKANHDFTPHDIGSSKKPLLFYFLYQSKETTRTAETKITELSKRVTFYDMRTVEILPNTVTTTDMITETYYMSSNSHTITVGYGIAKSPIIRVNSVTVPVGVNGLHEDSESAVFFFSYQSRELTLNLNLSESQRPSAGDRVDIDYQGFVPVRISVEDEESIEEIKERTGGSGKIEHLLNVTSPKSITEGEIICTTLLSQYGEEETEISLMTGQIDGTAIMTVWTFDYGQHQIEGDYVITERRAVYSPSGFLRIYLKLKDRGFMTAYGQAFMQNILNPTLVVREDETIHESSYKKESMIVSETWEIIYP